MSRCEQMRPYSSPKSSFLSFKSQTLNPEPKQQQLTFQFEQDRFLLMTASRAKRKLQQTATSNRRKFSFSSNQVKGSSMSNFQPSQTISHMTRQRHSIQANTQKLTNFHSYLCQRIHQKQIQQAHKKQKLQKLSQIFQQNKSQRKFFHRSIEKYNKKLYETKLISKSVVINHRKKRHQIIKMAFNQKISAGEIGRQQSRSNEKYIMEVKEKEFQGKKEAVERGRDLEEEMLKNKMQREELKKRIAGDNYRKKWMSQFMQKEKVERQNMIRNRKLGKKIQALLSQLDNDKKSEVGNNKI